MKILILLFIVSFNAFADFKDPEMQKAMESYAKERDTKLKECKKIKIMNHDLLEISSIVYKSDWSPCLEKYQVLKQVLESKTVGKENLALLKKEICTLGELNPEKNEWCDRRINECPACELGSFEMMYGKEDGPKRYFEYLENYEKWKKRRISFIQKYILKQESDFSWN